MKNAEIPTNLMQQQIDLYKKEKDILLALSDDITRVREKMTCWSFFPNELKGYTILHILSLLSLTIKTKLIYHFCWTINLLQ